MATIQRGETVRTDGALSIGTALLNHNIQPQQGRPQALPFFELGTPMRVSITVDPFEMPMQRRHPALFGSPELQIMPWSSLEEVLFNEHFERLVFIEANNAPLRSVRLTEVGTRLLRSFQKYFVAAHDPIRAAVEEWPAMANSRPMTGEDQAQLVNEFNRLAEQWRSETWMLSFTDQKAVHPAYQRIIGMGRHVVPVILRELRARPAHWFWALTAITGEDPVPPGATFSDAVEAWLSWGRDNGYTGT